MATSSGSGSSVTYSLTSFSRSGGAAGDKFGSAVAGIGDADGNGDLDFAVGAPGADTVVIFWGPSPYTTTTELEHPSGDSGINFGSDLEGGDTDVSGDGLPDLVIGATGFGASGGGSIHFNN